MAKSSVESVTWASDEDFASLKELAASLVQDGDLSKDDFEILSDAMNNQEERGYLSEKQREEIKDIISDGIEKHGSNELTKPLRAFAILSIIGGGVTVLMLVLSLIMLFTTGTSVAKNYQGSLVELAIVGIQSVMFVIGAIVHVILGVRLLTKKRYGAAQMCMALVVLGVINIFFSTLVDGASLNLLGITLITAFRVALSVYMSPSLARERRLAEVMRNLDTKYRAKTNTLGLDLEGKGYIKLDFFNIFWVFVVTCVLGLIVEVIWHMVVVEPGVYQDRAGLLFGPFSPIYGIGAVLMTVALNRFKNANLIVTFIICTIIGGAFEYLVSWWMEVAFGVIAWDYTGQFLNINGRTCLAFASMFGLLGLWWIKWALPRLLSLINKIPWKVRYSVTTVCAILMAINIGMTLMAMDCWQERVNGKPIVSEVQQFYADYFNDDVMQHRFQSMTMKPK